MPSETQSFFDPDKLRGPRRGPDVGRDITEEILTTGDELPAALTVSALVARVKSALAEAFPQTVAVVGEISNFKLHSSGHMYFSLKDAASAIDAAMFRQHARRLKFKPCDGLEVLVEGRVDVYDRRGQLQLYVQRMTPKGAGELELAFRQLREKLQREGLFAAEAKKPLCRYPRGLGVVSSLTGAAIRDIRRTLKRRWPAARVFLVPSLVQGEGAAEQVAEAIGLLDAAAERFGIDTIIVARGGGSLEDLWAFNEEIVARAIFAARTPIISGIGHEVDITIADLVADVRAPTPTGAAELAVPDRREVVAALASLRARLDRRVRQVLEAHRSALRAIGRSVVFRDPTWRCRMATQRLDEAAHRLVVAAGQRIRAGRRRLEPAANRLAALHPARFLEKASSRVENLLNRMRWALGGRSKRDGEKLLAVQGRLKGSHPSQRLKLARQRVEAAARQLDALSYRRVIRRGFSVTRREDGRILRSVQEVGDGDWVRTELADGEIASQVGRGASSDVPGRRKRPPSNPPGRFDKTD